MNFPKPFNSLDVFQASKNFFNSFISGKQNRIAIKRTTHFYNTHQNEKEMVNTAF